MNGIRLGLCCLFRDEPVRFRATTAAALKLLPREHRLTRLSELCLANCRSLVAATETVIRLEIGAFRIMSPLFPRCTHPEVGYGLGDLPDERAIREALEHVRRLRTDHDIRMSFHPDQFVVLSSPRDEVAAMARRELEYQAMVATLVGAEVINVHVGGAHGDKAAALARFGERFVALPDDVRRRLTVENDDRTFTVSDVLPLCRDLAIPLVYDVHHHRCNPDGLDEAAATAAAVETWRRVGREPWFHLSSPRDGWGSKNPRPHADYVDPADLPRCWLDERATIDVEAKAKERAVLRLHEDLRRLGGSAGRSTGRTTRRRTANGASAATAGPSRP